MIQANSSCVVSTIHYDKCWYSHTQKKALLAGKTIAYVRTVNVKFHKTINRWTWLITGTLRLINAKKGQHKLDEIGVERNGFAGAFIILAGGYSRHVNRSQEKEPYRITHTIWEIIFVNPWFLECCDGDFFLLNFQKQNTYSKTRSCICRFWWKFVFLCVFSNGFFTM